MINSNTKTFSENEVNAVYSSHVYKTPDYFNRFRLLDKVFSESELKKYGRMDPPRVISLIDFKEWIEKYNIKKGNSLLYTCDSDPELSYIDYSVRFKAEYPPHDLHKLNTGNKGYDFALFNQTIEHLYNPFLCVQNLYNALNDGRYLYTTVPIINIPHMVPVHYWGVTPMGLCLLMMSAGFKVMECGYWGNQKYLEYIFKNNTWPTYSDILTEEGVVDYNEACQAQTWILAKKE